MNETRQSQRHCSACGRDDHDRRQCPDLPASRTSRSRGFDPWLDLEWEEHTEAREICSRHPDGMTLEQVGHVLGVTRERVRQIEAIALEKLRTGLDVAQTVDIAGITAALTQCEECYEFFPREGRRKYCADHVHLQRTPRWRPPRLAAPVLELVATSEPVEVRSPQRARRTVVARRRPRTIGNTALADRQLKAFDSFVSSVPVELPTLEVVLDLPAGFE